MNAMIHALPAAGRCHARQDPDHHHCPRCREALEADPGGHVCPRCETVLICEVGTAPVYRTRMLHLRELERIAEIDAQGVDPAHLKPADLYFAATNRELPGTGPADPAPRPFPGAAGLALCILTCLAAGLVGTLLGRV